MFYFVCLTSALSKEPMASDYVPMICESRRRVTEATPYYMLEFRHSLAAGTREFARVSDYERVRGNRNNSSAFTLHRVSE